MFLLSARGVELEVQRDDDKVKSSCIAHKFFGLQRHLSILSVEALPFRLEILH